jgi:hypothetical protein
MKYLLVPEDLPSGDPDFPMEMARYQKSPTHHARLIPVNDDFAQKCRNVITSAAFWRNENIPDFPEVEI